MEKRDRAPRKKLALSRTTLRNLSPAELRNVGGGMTNESRLSECDCPTFTCNTGGTTSFTVSRSGTSCTQP